MASEIEGLGDIIKNNVSVTFGKGEDDKAQSLIDPCGCEWLRA